MVSLGKIGSDSQSLNPALNHLLGSAKIAGMPRCFFLLVSKGTLAVSAAITMVDDHNFLNVMKFFCDLDLPKNKLHIARIVWINEILGRARRADVVVLINQSLRLHKVDRFVDEAVIDAVQEKGFGGVGHIRK